MPNSTIKVDENNSITLDIISSAEVNIRTQIVDFPIPGGKPVSRPVALQPKELSLGIVIYGNNYNDIAQKRQAIEDFVEAHAYEQVILTCNPDPTLNGTYYIKSVRFSIDSRTWNQIKGNLIVTKIY